MVSSESGMSQYFSPTVQDGVRPLYAASQEGHTEVVDVLVKAGADVNQATTKVCEEIAEVKKYNSCLHYTCTSDNNPI